MVIRPIIRRCLNCESSCKSCSQSSGIIPDFCFSLPMFTCRYAVSVLFSVTRCFSSSLASLTLALVSMTSKSSAAFPALLDWSFPIKWNEILFLFCFFRFVYGVILYSWNTFTNVNYCCAGHFKHTSFAFWRERRNERE